jgi:hypothetical protein
MDLTLVKTLGRLEQVDLRKFWLDEAQDFTPWLSQTDNLDLLASTLGLELELEGMEVSVGPYKADIVARDIVSGTKVIIENQLEKTNHDHLGKTITYASGLGAKIIIWIAREFSEEHRRAIEYLNESAAPNLRIFAIEVQLWKIGNSLAAPLFKVVASPNEYAAIIKDDNNELTEAKSLYLEFWSEFRGYCKQKGSLLNLRKPRPQHWFPLAVGRSKFMLSLTVSIQKKRLGCEIYLRGPNAKKAFKLLEKEKHNIEQITGPLQWQELPDGQDCRIILYRPDLDVSDKSAWPQAFAWLKIEAETFHKAFSQRIKVLPILDAPGATIIEEASVEYPEGT